MGYWLGIDVGSTVTAAAVCRAEGQAEVVALGSGSAVVPSVVFLGEHDQVVGEAALRRAVADPDRLVRGFTGRIGDEVPMVVGGRAYTAAQLAATLIFWVVDQVSTQQGGPAEGIVVTHPATWGDYKREVLATSLAAAGLGQVRFCAEPEAVAAGQPIASGHTIAVYDLGGTTFDATVIHGTSAGGFTVLGQPQVLDQLGGVDFDDAVFGHVLAAVPGLTELDADDPTTLGAIAALRRDCSQAIQALSADTEVTIPVIAPGIQTQVRLHRAEFDDMIRPQLSETLQALHRALHTAQLEPHHLDAVVLVGGSSCIPLVAQLVSADLDQPVTIDADPTTTIARGAATLARGAALAHPAGTPPPDPAQPAFDPAPPPQRPSLTAIPLDVEPAEAQWRRMKSRRVTRIALASALAVLTAAGVGSVPFLIARSEPNPSAKPGTPATSAKPAPSTPASGLPPVPDPAGPVGSAGMGSEVSSGAAGSYGVVSTTSPRAPHQPAGGPAKPDAAAPPAGGPAPSWVTTYTWTTSWSNPPPTTSRTTTRAATTTASSTPPAPTTQPPHPTSTTTAPAPTTSPSNHRRPTT